MLGIFFFLTFYLSPIHQVNGFGELKLAIYNNVGELLNKTYIVQNINDTLILVCKTKLDNDNTSATKLTWILPPNKNRPPNRRSKVMKVNDVGLRLEVEHLQENDNGQYQCVDKNGSTTAINLKIIKGSLDCGRGVFCDNRCILERYKCDGVIDCKHDKKDESLALCGPDPCQDKIKCHNGRCIPQSWCCNISNENCTTKWDIKCCPKINRGPYPQDYNSMAGQFQDFRPYGDRPVNPVNYLNNPHPYADLNFLQTTIYAVFGCAILLLLIVTILVVVMQCKLQMRRNWQFQLLNRPRTYGNSTYQRALSQEVDIMDLMVERYNNQGNGNSRRQVPHQPQQRNSGGLLVTYNINNGVQIVGKPIEPPPYSEVAHNPPTSQGPPPPYLPILQEDVVGPSSNTKSDRKKKGGLSKAQASSEPTLTNIS